MGFLEFKKIRNTWLRMINIADIIDYSNLQTVSFCSKYLKIPAFKDSPFTIPILRFRFPDSPFLVLKIAAISINWILISF